MIRILQGLDELVDSDRDIQVADRGDHIVVVSALDEFYIEDIDDATALRDLLDTFITRRASP